MPFLDPDPLLTYPARYTVPEGGYDPKGVQQRHLDNGDLTQWEVERMCFLATEESRKKLNYLPRWKHLHNMLLCDFPPGGDQFTQHWWCEEMCYYLIEHNILLVWGPGGTGKSEVAGFIAWELFKAAPLKTSIYMVSTSLNDLQDRMYGAALKASEMPQTSTPKVGESRKEQALIYREVGEKRSGIFCKAFEEGDTMKTIKKRLGMHNRYTYLFVDEANGVPDSVWLAPSNLKRGAKAFGILALFNPDSWSGPMGQASRPVDTDLSRTRIVDYIVEGERPSARSHRDKVKSLAWRSEFRKRPACVLSLDLRRSHAYAHPEGIEVGYEEHNWVDPPEQFFEDLKAIGPENHDLYTQLLGCPPPDGFGFTVLSVREVETGRAQEGLKDTFPVTWAQEPIRGIGFDFAYNGTCQSIGIEGLHGIGRTGPADRDPWRYLVDVVALHEVDHSNSGNIISAITNWFLDIINNPSTPDPRPYTPHEIAMDASAGQTVIHGHLENQIGLGIYPVGWGETVGLTEKGRRKADKKGRSPGDKDFLRVNDKDQRLSSRVYKDRGAELAFNIKEFVIAGQVRRMPDMVVEQCCRRKVISQSPIQLERKRDAGNDEQWDALDAFAALLAKFRERDGRHPAMAVPPQFQGIAASSSFDTGTRRKPESLLVLPQDNNAKHRARYQPTVKGFSFGGGRNRYLRK